MLPKDPIMLLSFINTQLRDNYPSLEELCKSLDANMQEIIEKLKTVNYEYNEELNKFI